MNKLEHRFIADVAVPLNPNAVIRTMCNACGKNTVAIAYLGSCYECMETFPVERMEHDTDLA
ncbi:MAG: hypothetical protein AABX33_03905 [Nanoarchaeota archaeon]